MRSPQLRVVSVVVLAVVLIAGCQAHNESADEQSVHEGTTAGKAITAGTPAGDTKPVLMLGRSVMWGWFKHWGCDGTPESMPIERDGYSLTYSEIAAPPDIATSATDRMDEAREGSVVFFKFCFDDFPGGEDAATRFEDQKDWIEAVVAKAEERRQRVIIGNALPKVALSTDPTLVAEHRQFNARLADYAANSDGNVLVYDFYGVLAGSDGALKADYASSPDDSHPNDRGYAELDPSFFELLGQVAQ